MIARSRERMDALTAFAEFGPGSFAGVDWDADEQRARYRLGDGLGCTGYGASWEDAANALRDARAEHERRVAVLDREAAEYRERVARLLGNVLLWGFLAAAALAAVWESVR